MISVFIFFFFTNNSFFKNEVESTVVRNMCSTQKERVVIFQMRLSVTKCNKSRDVQKKIFNVIILSLSK